MQTLTPWQRTLTARAEKALSASARLLQELNAPPSCSGFVIASLLAICAQHTKLLRDLGAACAQAALPALAARLTDACAALVCAAAALGEIAADDLSA